MTRMLSSSSDARYEQIKGLFGTRLGVAIGVPAGAWTYAIGGVPLTLTLFGAVFLVAVVWALIDIYRWQKEMDRA